VTIAESTWIAFDTETSGAFPVGSEVIEIGAIKFKGLQEVGQMQLLIRPKKRVPDEVVAIHNITNNMLEFCPESAEIACTVRDFFSSDFYVAHHASFDLGFMAYFFESEGKSLPQGFGLCTSLLARKTIGDVENHKLQTLAKKFGIESGLAHRALDDARVCANLFKIIVEQKLEGPAGVKQLQAIQGSRLNWEQFSVRLLPAEWINVIEFAVHMESDLEVVYKKGIFKGIKRRIKPLGIVRSPLDGDYIPAWCYIDKKRKRFMFDQFQEIQGLA